MFKKSIIAGLAVTAIFTAMASSANAQTMAPDGSFVGGSSYTMAPDGSFVDGSSYTMAPDGSFVSAD